jgi:hypothetical protein
VCYYRTIVGVLVVVVVAGLRMCRMLCCMSQWSSSDAWKSSFSASSGSGDSNTTNNNDNNEWSGMGRDIGFML